MPESHFKLKYTTDYESMVQIKCSAFNVYPEPKLSLKYDLLDITLSAHGGAVCLWCLNPFEIIPQHFSKTSHADDTNMERQHEQKHHKIF